MVNLFTEGRKLSLVHYQFHPRHLSNLVCDLGHQVGNSYSPCQHARKTTNMETLSQLAPDPFPIEKPTHDVVFNRFY
jgi:hypothetical protein